MFLGYEPSVEAVSLSRRPKSLRKDFPIVKWALHLVEAAGQSPVLQVSLNRWHDGYARDST